MCIILKKPIKKKSEPIEVTISEKKKSTSKGDIKPKEDRPKALSEKQKAALQKKIEQAKAAKMEKARADARKMAEAQLKALGMLRKEFPRLFGNTNNILEKSIGLPSTTTNNNGYFGIGIYQDPMEDTRTGMTVRHVVPGYPADQNGIQAGDIVVECDGHNEYPDHYIQGTGKTPIHLTIARNGRLIELNFIRDWISTDGTSHTSKP